MKYSLPGSNTSWIHTVYVDYVILWFLLLLFIYVYKFVASSKPNKRCIRIAGMTGGHRLDLIAMGLQTEKKQNICMMRYQTYIRWLNRDQIFVGQTEPAHTQINSVSSGVILCTMTMTFHNNLSNVRALHFYCLLLVKSHGHGGHESRWKDIRWSKITWPFTSNWK